MRKLDVMIARFPYGASDHPDTTDWLAQTLGRISKDPRIGRVFSERYDDTPITMTRNKAVKDAQKAVVDVLCMVDSDMKPDAYLPTNRYRLGTDPDAKPFWDTSFDFLLDHPTPCVIGAPYCGRPPIENVFVFRWATDESNHPNVRPKLEQFSREEAAMWKGIAEVAALPTGLILYDMRAFDAIKPPYFEYEWEDETASAKGSTEDVYNTRDLSLAGVKQYCNWDAWAGHWKMKCVGKPQPMPVDAVRASFHECITRGWNSRERIMEVQPSAELLNRAEAALAEHEAAKAIKAVDHSSNMVAVE